ncbi:MAG: FtsQ-type POTRA domain-containing protein [Acidobacteriota bacterium]|nr:FtsQ-type POTRA domain-containing protein [Acidobacteriota bacterium]
MVPEETLERAAVDDVSPRYLRKQKPAEVKRRRSEPLGKRLRRGTIAFAVVVGVSGIAGWCAYFLFFSPATRLGPRGVRITGEHFVARGELMSVFAPDMGRSVLRVPLDERLAQIDAIPWIRQAAVERVLPDRIMVQVVERQPAAFLSTGSGMKLIDVDGVILDRPEGSNSNLPVVTGLDARTPVGERARRVALFSEFLKQIGTVRPDAAGGVSQANLASGDDLQVTLANVPVLAGQGPVIVHFGNADFANRFHLFLENFPSWEAKAGNVEAVDLRYDGQALVTPGPALPKATNAAGSAKGTANPRPQAAAPQRSMAAESIRKGTERR